MQLDWGSLIYCVQTHHSRSIDDYWSRDLKKKIPRIFRNAHSVLSMPWKIHWLHSLSHSVLQSVWSIYWKIYKVTGKKITVQRSALHCSFSTQTHAHSTVSNDLGHSRECRLVCVLLAVGCWVVRMRVRNHVCDETNQLFKWFAVIFSLPTGGQICKYKLTFFRFDCWILDFFL